jgi:hypothetical protein
MRRITLVVALALLGPALSGCLGSIDNTVDDSNLELGSNGSDDGQETVLRVFVQRMDAGDYGSASTTVAEPAAQPAKGAEVTLDAPEGHVDLASQDPVPVGTAKVDPGQYDSVAFTLTDVHGTHDGSEYEIPDLGLRVDVDAGVPVDEGSTTTVIVGADLSAAGDPATGFDPAFPLLGARQDGTPVDLSGNGTGSTGEPPVARAEVFNGTGVKIYESNFEAPGGETEAVNKRETVTWTARPSDDPDGSVASYEWSFSDGASATGTTVKHAFETGGIHSATLQVTDDRGNTDTLDLEIPVRYLVSEDGEDLFDGNASGSFAAGGDELAPGEAQENTREEHTFEVPSIKRTSSSESDGSGESGNDTDASGPDDGTYPGTSIPIHGGGHGAGDVEDPDSVRRLAAATFDLTWSGQEDAYTLQVSRDGEVLAEKSGDTGNLSIELNQLDGHYLDGGNYTAQVQYDQGVEGSYELDVTGTYIPIPTK